MDSPETEDAVNAQSHYRDIAAVIPNVWWRHLEFVYQVPWHGKIRITRLAPEETKKCRDHFDLESPDVDCFVLFIRQLLATAFSVEGKHVRDSVLLKYVVHQYGHSMVDDYIVKGSLVRHLYPDAHTASELRPHLTTDNMRAHPEFHEVILARPEFALQTRELSAIPADGGPWHTLLTPFKELTGVGDLRWDGLLVTARFEVQGPALERTAGPTGVETLEVKHVKVAYRVLAVIKVDLGDPIQNPAQIRRYNKSCEMIVPTVEMKPSHYAVSDQKYAPDTDWKVGDRGSKYLLLCCQRGPDPATGRPESYVERLPVPPPRDSRYRPWEFVDYREQDESQVTYRLGRRTRRLSEYSPPGEYGARSESTASSLFTQLRESTRHGLRSGSSDDGFEAEAATRSNRGAGIQEEDDDTDHPMPSIEE
ncbi:hypothetical protein F5Y17DRAFT_459517 [Xylariaceae sp. FL0594]|nr:hypothetical protein F5Y17DRAFT_459517 [Xylariaceae sp. FL0594]